MEDWTVCLLAARFYCATMGDVGGVLCGWVWVHAWVWGWGGWVGASKEGREKQDATARRENVLGMSNRHTTHPTRTHARSHTPSPSLFAHAGSSRSVARNSAPRRKASKAKQNTTQKQKRTEQSMADDSNSAAAAAPPVPPTTTTTAPFPSPEFLEASVVRDLLRGRKRKRKQWAMQEWTDGKREVVKRTHTHIKPTHPPTLPPTHPTRTEQGHKVQVVDVRGSDYTGTCP